MAEKEETPNTERVEGSTEPSFGTPGMPSPPITKTPPTIERQTQPRAELRDTTRSSTPVDANALTRALEHAEGTSGRQRDESRSASPNRKRQRVYGDRFIPNRQGHDLHAGYNLMHDEGSPASVSQARKRTPHDELHFQQIDKANQRYNTVLRSELFDGSIPTAMPSVSGGGASTTRFSGGGRANTPPSASSSLNASNLSPSTPHKNLFSYKSPKHHSASGPLSPSRTPSSRRSINMDTRSEIYSLSPVKISSQQLLLSPQKKPRAVSKVPYKVLDAPELEDDFYLNLVDWGSSNILGVGLGSSVYTWDSNSGKVEQLCQLNDDKITSLSWIQRGSHLAIGTGKGYVQIWDAERKKRLRTMTGHTARAGALAWNQHILTSGSRDRSILHRDVRAPDQYVKRLSGHKQEVCGLRWNDDDQQLASGGNDNKLLVWENLNTEPLYRFTDHTAAVKAIAWSPHQRGLLASGGGTADRHIRFWNTMNGTKIQEMDTGSQVCNLAWSKNTNEIVSTHGYSQHQVVVWKYPSMTEVVTLTGHTFRVLYLAMSPDGQVIVTGAGDETLRFWNCFKKKDNTNRLMAPLDDWGSIR